MPLVEGESAALIEAMSDALADAIYLELADEIAALRACPQGESPVAAAKVRKAKVK
jgi:hypothetical protein